MVTPFLWGTAPKSHPAWQVCSVAELCPMNQKVTVSDPGQGTWPRLQAGSSKRGKGVGFAGGSWTKMFLSHRSFYFFPFLKIKTFKKNKHKVPSRQFYLLSSGSTSVLDVVSTGLETQKPKGYALFSHILSVQGWNMTTINILTQTGKNRNVIRVSYSGYGEGPFLFTKNSLLHCSLWFHIPPSGRICFYSPPWLYLNGCLRNMPSLGNT